MNTSAFIDFNQLGLKTTLLPAQAMNIHKTGLGHLFCGNTFQLFLTLEAQWLKFVARLPGLFCIKLAEGLAGEDEHRDESIGGPCTGSV